MLNPVKRKEKPKIPTFSIVDRKSWSVFAKRRFFTPFFDFVCSWVKLVKDKTSDQILSMLIDEIHQIKAAGREFLEARGTGIRVPQYLRYLPTHRARVYGSLSTSGTYLPKGNEYTGPSVQQVHTYPRGAGIRVS